MHVNTDVHVSEAWGSGILEPESKAVVSCLKCALGMELILCKYHQCFPGSTLQILL